MCERLRTTCQLPYSSVFLFHLSHLHLGMEWECRQRHQTIGITGAAKAAGLDNILHNKGGECTRRVGAELEPEVAPTQWTNRRKKRLRSQFVRQTRSRDTRTYCRHRYRWPTATARGPVRPRCTTKAHRRAILSLSQTEEIEMQMEVLQWLPLPLGEAVNLNAKVDEEKVQGQTLTLPTKRSSPRCRR